MLNKLIDSIENGVNITDINFINSDLFDYSKDENNIKILSPNLYKIYEKLLLSLKLKFLNGDGLEGDEDWLFCESKKGISSEDVMQTLEKICSIKNSTYSTYIGFGMVSFISDRTNEAVKQPIVLLPVSIFKEDGGFSLKGDFSYEKVALNIRLFNLLNYDKGITIPKFLRGEKLFNYFDKLTSICSDSGVTVSENCDVVTLDLTRERLALATKLNRDKLIKSDLLKYIYRENSDSLEIVSKIDEIDDSDKIATLLNFATNDFYTEELSPLNLINLGFSIKVNYVLDDLYQPTNKQNFLKNIVSSSIKNKKKLLYVSDVKNLDDLYNSYKLNPLKDFILNTTPSSLDYLASENSSSFIRKKKFEKDSKYNSLEVVGFEDNLKKLLKYSVFLEKEILPLKLSPQKAILKYFELKETAVEVDLDFVDVQKISMLDIHQYIHDINSFVKIYNEKSNLVSGIWFNSNLSNFSEKQVADIKKRLNILHVEKNMYVKHYEKINEIGNVDFSKMNKFYSFCKDLRKHSSKDYFEVVDYNYDELVHDVNTYNEEKSLIMLSRKRLLSDFDESILEDDLTTTINDTYEKIEFVLSYLDDKNYNSDILYKEIEEVSEDFDTIYFELEKSLELFSLYEKEYDYTPFKNLNMLSSMSSSFMPFYKENTVVDELFKEDKLIVVHENLEDLLELQKDIKYYIASVKTVFNKEIFNTDLDEFTANIDEYLTLHKDSFSFTKYVNNRYKELREYLKNLLIFEKELKEVELLKEKHIELLAYNKKLIEFNEKASKIGEIFGNSLTIQSPIKVYLQQTLDVREILSFFGGEIPPKLICILVGDKHQNTLDREIFRRTVEGFGRECNSSINKLFKESYIHEFFDNDLLVNLGDLRTINEDINQIIENKKEISKYLKGDIPLSKISDSIHLSRENLQSEEENRHLKSSKLEKVQELLYLSKDKYISIKDEVLVFEKGKKIGLNLQELNKFFKDSKSDVFNEYYSVQMANRFKDFWSEVSYFTKLLNLDVDISSFSALNTLVEACVNSFSDIENNMEVFDFLNNKCTTNIKPTLIAFDNQNIPKDKFIDTFMLSFYKSWISNIFVNSDIKDDISINNLRENTKGFFDFIYQQTYDNRYDVYNSYAQDLPSIDINKKYYDEREVYKNLFKKKANLLNYLEETPYILQNFKPVFFGEVCSLKKMLPIKHFSFDTIIFDTNNINDVKGLLPLFADTSQIVFINTVENKENMESVESSGYNSDFKMDLPTFNLSKLPVLVDLFDKVNSNENILKENYTENFSSTLKYVIMNIRNKEDFTSLHILKDFNVDYSYDNNHEIYRNNAFYDFYDSYITCFARDIPFALLWSIPFVVDLNYRKETENLIPVSKHLVVDKFVPVKEHFEVKSNQRFFDTYVSANVYDIAPSSTENGFITNGVIFIVNVEAPIHQDKLALKLHSALNGVYSMAEIFNKINELYDLELCSVIDFDNGFYMPKDFEVVPRYHDFDTSLNYVSDIEITKGILKILSNTIGITLDNILRQTLYEFGFEYKNDEVLYLKNIFVALEKEGVISLKENKVTYEINS